VCVCVCVCLTRGVEHAGHAPAMPPMNLKHVCDNPGIDVVSKPTTDTFEKNKMKS
jgi:hypothetical protein